MPLAAQLVAREGEVLRMPAAQGSNAEMLAWLQVAASEDRLLAAKSDAMNQRFGGRSTSTCPPSGAATVTTPTLR
jgi:hypothetical protein